MNNNKLDTMRHSAAHLMAAAISRLYPNARFGVGPVVEGGFYYDIDLEEQLTADDLRKVEKEMEKLQKLNLAYERQDLPIAEAIQLFKKLGQDYKVELLNDLKKHGTTVASEIYGGEDEKKSIVKSQLSKVSIYKTGDFVDLCRGPHVGNTKEIGAFKLLKIAGAYWRGNAENKMLQRVYGTAFLTKVELAKHLLMLEEAQKRDHKILGPALDLFVFSDLVGPGLPLWTPKGTILRDILDDFVWELREARGYEKVEIPHITKKELYETSGHWDKFKDDLFRINTREGHEFAMKPMNCPHHAQIYSRRRFSYRELPQRYANTTMVYRDEQTGELSGLSRVRSITQDDSHVFLRRTQIEREVFAIWDIIDEFYQAFGFELNVRLSLSDPKQPKKYLGKPEDWRRTEESLRALAKKRKVKVEEAAGEAAFYGPKVDFVAKDSLGREWQVATIQLDFNQPERFNLFCVNEKGEEERIVMIHCAVMGSLERFISVLIEHYAGVFPAWLSPVQIALLPVSNEKHLKFVQKLSADLRERGARVWLDDSDETVGKKIRSAESQKIPFMLVLGDKEMGGGKLAVRARGQKETVEMTIDELISLLRR